MIKLSSLRRDVPPHSMHEFKDGNGKPIFEFAIVLLNMEQIRRCGEQVVLFNKNNEVDDPNYSEVIFNINLVYHCMRQPDNLDMHIANGIDEIQEFLSEGRMNYIVEQYYLLEAVHSPKSLELLTNEEMEELKKLIGQIQLSNLSTISQAHLKSFLHLQNLKG